MSCYIFSFKNAKKYMIKVQIRIECAKFKVGSRSVDNIDTKKASTELILHDWRSEPSISACLVMAENLL